MTITNLTTRRLKAVRIALGATVDATTRAIATAWSGAFEEIADEWTAAVDQLLTIGAGEWPTAAQISRATRATRAMRLTVERLSALTEAAGVTITGEIGDLVAISDEWEHALISSQLPTGALDWARVDTKAIDAIVQRTTGRIESSLRPLPADQQAVMKQVLVRGVMVGDNPRTAANLMLKRLGGAFDGGRARAQVIARTELLDSARSAAQASRMANSDVLKGWMWTATKSDRTCPSCLALDGRVFALDAPGPQDHPCGRCTAVPVTKSYKDLGLSIEEPPSDYQTGRAWFDAQSRATQLKIMGAERLKRLDAGTLDWEAIPVLHENPDWRASYGVRPLAA